MRPLPERRLSMSHRASECGLMAARSRPDITIGALGSLGISQSGRGFLGGPGGDGTIRRSRLGPSVFHFGPVLGTFVYGCTIWRYLELAHDRQALGTTATNGRSPAAPTAE